jgi:RNA polymerase sigma-70 factor (ECF subfamily)
MKPDGRARTLQDVTGDEVGEAALWARSLSGDAEAFAAIFDRHRDRVFRQAARLVEARDEAEDIAAAAFLELWRRRQDVRLVSGSVLPWLLVTTSNLARNAVRARRRYRTFLARLPRQEPAPDAATIAMDGTVLGIQPELRAALRSLPEQDLHLLSLVAFEDLSLADAAAVLNITPSAAKSRLHRVRERMRAQLGDYEATTTAPGGSR